MNPLNPAAGAPSTLTALSVNVNLVAYMRNRRALTLPSVVLAAEHCLQAGAQGITVHPRPDERHIRATDVAELSQLLRAWPQAEFNVEGNPLHNLMAIVREFKPHQATLVPDAMGQSTSDHGWRMPADLAVLAPIVREIKDLGVRVSLFMDPEPAAMAAVQSLGADRVELYTEAYAKAHGTAQQDAVLARYVETAETARALGLGVNAGHDLNRNNLPDLVRAMPFLAEVSIGHALIADALELGLAATVRAYRQCMDAAWTGHGHSR